ncbi:hypothetical protein MTO96_014233 [Rhipicephalus appendiculatus]
MEQASLLRRKQAANNLQQQTSGWPKGIRSPRDGKLRRVFVVQTKEGVLKPRVSDNSEHDGGDGSSPPVLRLKGQMVSVEETNSILFLCSPRVKDIDDMQRIGLFFSDLAIHDPARELFLRSHHHRGERELIEKLDEATNRLRMLQSKLDEDKKRTEELLHSILPSKASFPEPANNAPPSAAACGDAGLSFVDADGESESNCDEAGWLDAFTALLVVATLSALFEPSPVVVSDSELEVSGFASRERCPLVEPLSTLSRGVRRTTLFVGFST